MSDATNKRPSVTRLLMVLMVRTVLILLLWLVISEFDEQLVTAGTLTAVLVALVSIRLLPPHGLRLSLPGLIRFVPYFGWRSLLGGFDVAYRAYHPRLPLAPCMIEHRLALTTETERTLLLLIVSLLPGTLAVRIDGNHLGIHCLDDRGDQAAAIAELEQRIAGLFRQRSY